MTSQGNSGFQPQPVQTRAWALYNGRSNVRFATSVAPRIRSVYEATPLSKSNFSLLDVCCGQGQLMKHFLDHDYTATGIDLSQPQLDLARETLGKYLKEGRAQLVKADAAAFSIDGEFGLATSTFDSLNMLQSLKALKNCFLCARSAVVEEGLFVFDLMTKVGFGQDYNQVIVKDTESAFWVWKGVYNGGPKAAVRATGFIKTDEGIWERFEEFRTPTFFSPDVVVEALRETGWPEVRVTNTEDLAQPVEDPEKYDRVFYVASS